jgi:hypothetical protein
MVTSLRPLRMLLRGAVGFAGDGADRWLSAAAGDMATDRFCGCLAEAASEAYTWATSASPRRCRHEAMLPSKCRRKSPTLASATFPASTKARFFAAAARSAVQCTLACSFEYMSARSEEAAKACNAESVFRKRIALAPERAERRLIAVRSIELEARFRLDQGGTPTPIPAVCFSTTAFSSRQMSMKSSAPHFLHSQAIYNLCLFCLPLLSSHQSSHTSSLFWRMPSALAGLPSARLFFHRRRAQSSPSSP